MEGGGDAPAGRLSAASGLVRRDGRQYVLADDEHHLAVFDATAGKGRWVRLLDGELPNRRRKAAKPDLETLIELPESEEFPFGALLALGSGSRPNRQTGVVASFDVNGELNVPPRLMSLAELYEPLRREFGDLNIEGGFQIGNEFCLLQRANRKQPRNVCSRFAWNEIGSWLCEGRYPVPSPKAFEPYDLGSIECVVLGFTDAATLPGGEWVFSAVAEATDNSYLDGACVGSAIGLVAADGRLLALHRLEGRWKVEGIAASVLSGGEMIELTLVTDADDRSRPTSSLTVRMPRES